MTASVGGGVVIDAIPLAPPRISLLSSVDVTEYPTDAEWTGGIRFLPEGCDLPANPYWWACPDPGGAAPTFQKVLPDPETPVTFRPFDIWTGFKCSAMSVNAVDFPARARRALEAYQSYLIARELWTGAYVATPGSFDNDYFENSPSLLNGGANTPYVTALAELEQALATCQPGQVGVIHAMPRTVVLWLQNGLVAAEPSGRRLRTQLGTIVVPDAGYDGGGTALGTGGVASAYAYGTGMVRVFLGPISRAVSEAQGGRASAGIDQAEFTRETNDVDVRVERAVAAVWDECCHVGVRVNHTTAL